MAKGNQWTVEGYLGRKDYIKKGTSKAGNTYMIHSVAVYSGKDKQTGKNLYDNISFFVPKDDHGLFESLPDKQKIRLRGKPACGSYVNKEGELVKKLNFQPDWENYFDLIDTEAQVPDTQDYAEESDLPF